MRALHIVVPVGLLLGGFVACGGDDSAPPTGTGGSSATGGSGGSTGGSGGTRDASVDTSTGGTAGTAGSGGASGSGGTAGKGGTGGGGTGGASGSGGTGGATGGASGSGGTAGKGGTAGSGGTGGASGSGGAAGTAGTGGAAGTAGTGGAAGSAGTGGAGGTGGGTSVSVLMHHNNPNRDGVYVDPVFTKAAAATMHVDTTFAMATYTASAYAQPLYLAGAGSVPDLVIVATTQNHIIAFNAATGAKVWDQTLGTPVPQSALCGSAINPSGIIGTPVIDAASRTIYFGSKTNSTGSLQDLVYAVSADTGMTKAGWPVDVTAKAKSGATNFNSQPQNQRGALALVGGRVLVPYGGHNGDCGDYRGWVVSISTSDPTMLTTYATTVLGGGIWAPSGVASDGTHVFFATGNTMGTINNPFSHPAMYGGGESVFNLPPDLTRSGTTTDYFVPTNWSQMDDADDDIGGTGPLLVDLAGATPSKLIVQLGKDGKAYLINRDMMGGQSAALASPTVSGTAIITAAATYKTAMGTYVVFRNTGTSSAAGCPSGAPANPALVALRLTAGAPPTIATAWCAGATSNKSPAVSMSNAMGADALVWQIGNDGKLRAFDGDTGAAVFSGGGTGDTMTAVAQFQTPIIANGRIFASANAQTYAFKP